MYISVLTAFLMIINRYTITKRCYLLRFVTKFNIFLISKSSNLYTTFGKGHAFLWAKLRLQQKCTHSYKQHLTYWKVFAVAASHSYVLGIQFVFAEINKGKRDFSDSQIVPHKWNSTRSCRTNTYRKHFVQNGAALLLTIRKHQDAVLTIRYKNLYVFVCRTNVVLFQPQSSLLELTACEFTPHLNCPSGQRPVTGRVFYRHGFWLILLHPYYCISPSSLTIFFRHSHLFPIPALVAN